MIHVTALYVVVVCNSIVIHTVDIQAMNYYGALEKYNVMVSSSNFSEVSSFLPGIKSLLQLGMQLRV